MEIDQNIPAPETWDASAPRTELGRLVRQMKPGHSILCQTLSQRDTVRCLIRHLGGKTQSRKVAEGWRVWRVA